MAQFYSSFTFWNKLCALLILPSRSFSFVVALLFFCGTALPQGLALQKSPGQAITRTEAELLQHLAVAQDTMRVVILDSLAWIYRGTDLTRAMTYARRGQNEAVQLGYPRVRAENQNYTGIIYRNVGNYAKAMEYFLEARRIAEEYGYKREEGYALNNIGEIYKYQRKYKEAREFSTNAMRLFRFLHDDIGQYYCCIRLGELSQILNDYPSALSYFQQAILLSQSFQNKVWESGALNRIGQIYRLQGLYNDALRIFAKALRISENASNDEDEQAYILVQIDKTYQTMGKTDSAKIFLMRGLRLAERIGLKNHIRDAAKSLADIAVEQRNYGEAVSLLKIQMTMNDSLFSEAGRKEIEKLSTKYELEQQQNAIESLNTAQNQTRMIVLGMFCGLLLLGIIAFLLFRNARAEHKANAEILRQQKVLEEQSREIEISNSKLQEQNAELAQLNNEKTELMNIVAHDLKNPIGAVRGLAELIATGHVDASATAQGVAQQIVSTGDRMLNLVSNVLNSNRLESGGVGYQLVKLDILPIVEATCDQYQSAAQAKNIVLAFQPVVSVGRIIADEQAIMQILDNLISNAVKYSPHGKNINVEIRNRDAEEQKDVESTSFLQISVADEGPGLSEDDQKKLFGKFARLSARPTGGEHSTGLGLSIVKKMVEAMNGKVWCESELGKGATFIVEFPRVDGKEI